VNQVGFSLHNEFSQKHIPDHIVIFLSQHEKRACLLDHLIFPLAPKNVIQFIHSYLTATHPKKSSQGSFVERPPCGIQAQAITKVITFLIFYVL
jgi:hypothetical protein